MPTVSIKSENKDFELPENEIIFDGLDNQGHELPHGCLAGSCGACRIQVLSGAENLKSMSEIEANTVEAVVQNYERIHGKGSLNGKTIRLSCRTRIISGKVEIEPLN